jgi:ABC-2 type transport system permease protein
MNTNVLYAVFKRNFVNYFANPTGYVFILLFVFLSGVAAFWPHEFFNRNLANLDQLSWAFPLIMLVFIPAITMSVWADERRQGTDELLLTIPATDFDVVLGKYLAALAIFSISLAFSLVCNLWILSRLGEPDWGLFLATNAGYWMIGAAMLGIGMVASFLTGNLTVAYVLGVVFNAPLVLLMFADSIFQPSVAVPLKQWGFSEQFRDFGRGVISLSGTAYMGMVAAVCLYLSMVFIGRRHWRGERGSMSAAVFYPLLHVLWLASFATFAVFLATYFSLASVLVGLATAYIVLQAALVWGWECCPGKGGSKALAYLIPVLQAALLGGFVATAVLVWRSGGVTEANQNMLLGLFAAYAVAHLVLAAGWWRLPQHASLVPAHYIVRFLALVLVAVGLSVLLKGHDARLDVSAEKLSSLSPATLDLIKHIRSEYKKASDLREKLTAAKESDKKDEKKIAELQAEFDKAEVKWPIQIEAFVSPEVPEWYAATRLNLISTLQEIGSRAGDVVQVRINNTQPATEESNLADRRFGIAARPVETMVRGTSQRADIFLGVAFVCGLEKRTIPFLDRGLSTEYELVRSMVTVTQQKRKRLGVLLTDAPLMSRFGDGPTGSDWPIVEELRKQYEVVKIDPASKITENVDAILAVQPSSLPPDQFENFMEAVRSGKPTAIFEDPLPYFAGNVPATTAQRRAPGGMMNPMMQMQQPPMPKAENGPLWDLLGVRFSQAGSLEKPGEEIVYQLYNPFPKLSRLTEDVPEFVFVDKGSGADKPFNNDSDITSKLQHLLFPFPGYIEDVRPGSSKLTFTPLVETGRSTGTVRAQDTMNPMYQMMPGMDPINPRRKHHPKGKAYNLAVAIQGTVPASSVPFRPMAAEQAGETKTDAKTTEAKPETKPEAKPQDAKINVVLVADIDMLHQAFFRLREMGEIPQLGQSFDFDNVTFVLNVVDELSGDKKFLDIRKRRPTHRTLTKIDERIKEFYKQKDEAMRDVEDKFEKIADEARKANQDFVKKLEDDLKTGKAPTNEVLQTVAMTQREKQKELDAKLEQLERDKKKKNAQLDTKLNLDITRVQNSEKLLAVLVPPILPLVLGITVFISRRYREREGVSRRRLRS